MSDFPNPISWPAPTHIHTGLSYCQGEKYATLLNSGVAGSAAWIANMAAYMPLALPFPYIVRRMFWVNGSIATSNVDVGIYTFDGEALWTAGSTGQSGASAAQYVSLATPLELTPGLYYLAYTCSSTTNRAFVFTNGSVNADLIGMLKQDSALPLPVAMTPAAWVNTLGRPLMGITNTATGF